MKQTIKIFLLGVILSIPFISKGQTDITVNNTCTTSNCCFTVRVYDNINTLLATITTTCPGSSNTQVCISGLIDHITIDDGSGCTPYLLYTFPSSFNNSCASCSSCSACLQNALVDISLFPSGVTPTCLNPNRIRVDIHN